MDSYPSVCGLFEIDFLNHFLDDKCNDAHPNAHAIQPEGDSMLLKCYWGFIILGGQSSYMGISFGLPGKIKSRHPSIIRTRWAKKVHQEHGGP